MTSEEIVQKVQSAYDYANSVMPNYPLWLKYSRGSFVATVDISDGTGGDDVARRLSKYGYDDDILFSSEELQASGMTLDELADYPFGAIPVEVA